VLGQGRVVVDDPDSEENDEPDFRGEKWGAGESRVLDAKRTRCSRSVAEVSGSMEGERGNREPGIDIEDERFIARGKGRGEGECCVPSSESEVILLAS